MSTSEDAPIPTSAYYADKLDRIRALLGDPQAALTGDAVVSLGRVYPILDDVIIALDSRRWPPFVRGRLAARAPANGTSNAEFAPDIQHSFGAEWKRFPHILPEHEETFRQYFDLVELDALADKTVLDLGCGMGRWSFFLAPYCRELVLVDYSEAIFVARENLRGRHDALFVMADVLDLPFANDCADFAFSLGVLHHLPVPALQAVRALRRLAPILLIYLYYALDNRPYHYRVLLRAVTPIRQALSRVRAEWARGAISSLLAWTVYRPLVLTGLLLDRVGLAGHVPLYEGYRGRSMAAIRQDAYDRFFTRIEQRVSRREIADLRDSFTVVDIAPTFPYWHFVCRR